MENNCGKRQSKYAPITHYHSLSTIQMKDVLQNVYNIRIDPKMKREDMCNLLSQNEYVIKPNTPQTSPTNQTRKNSPIDITRQNARPNKLPKNEIGIVLENINNSCYIDSVILALFHPVVTLNYETFWYKYTLKTDLKKKADTPQQKEIKKELNSIVFQIHATFKNDKNEVTTCNKLRRLFQKYPSTFNRTEKNEWLHTQQDPVDVIAMLEHVFEIPSRNIFSTGNSQNGTPKDDERAALIGYAIPPYMLQTHSKFSDIYPNPGRVLKSSGFLYVQIYRNNRNKLENPFTVPLRMDGMQLVSAIIHKGSSGDYGHYVAMLKIGNTEWVYYDDQNDIMERFQESRLYMYKTGILKTSGIGYLYISI